MDVHEDEGEDELVDLQRAILASVGSGLGADRKCGGSVMLVIRLLSLTIALLLPLLLLLLLQLLQLLLAHRRKFYRLPSPALTCTAGVVPGLGPGLATRTRRGSPR